ncbi:endolytic transglycosylase MltG [Candidatus Peregrinibacteria bacterium]|nr:endolytic transglycosylase MltG [Candidatus Peregrinibacteria bacterium]
MRKISLFVIGALVVTGYVSYRSYVSAVNFEANPDSDQRVTVVIPKGSSADAVADLLLEKGLIKSPLFFKLYLRSNGLAGQLKAGRFVLMENYDMPAIASALVEGKSAELAVTLLEGWTARQIGDYLESLGLTTADNFVKCVETCTFKSTILPIKGSIEGYLYPDTYFVDAGSYSDEAFISRLVGTLESKLTAEDLKAIKDGQHSLQDVIKMASIVEREERDDAERPTIAGILWKRFDNGIGLGADATILYALGRTKGGLTYDELQTDSPYNTRKYRGLPPTPISNPHISSIRSAIYPKASSYLYYLHGSDGQVHYGKTLEEHNENKRRYL